MLLLLFLFIFIIGIIFTFKKSIIDLLEIKYGENKILKHIYYVDNIELFGAVAIVISSIILFIAINIFLCVHIEADANYNKYKERYNANIYKIENYKNEDSSSISNYFLINQIQQYNEEIIYYKTMNDNFWVGIFIPDIYNDLETIDYEDIK